MPSKSSVSVEDLLEDFAVRAERSASLPNINRYQAMPQQELFHKSVARGRIPFGGNRSGKTYSGIADDVLILTRKHPWRAHLYPSAGQPIRMRFIGVDFDRGIDQIALPLFSQMIPPSFLVNGSWEDSYRPANHMLTLADKSTVSFMSYEQHPNKFQGVSLHHIHFDEEPPKAIFEESMMRLVDTNGTWTLTETPVQQLEWIEDELMVPAREKTRSDIEVFYLDTRANVHLSEEALHETMQGMSVEDQLVRLAGQYKSGSLVFGEFTRKYPNVISAGSFHLTPEWAVYESMDWGYVNPGAWLWTAVHPDGSIITFRGIYGKGMVVSEQATLVKQKRIEIMQDFGLSRSQWGQMHRGTFGDPSIADRGLSTAQTGITIQQAFANEGVGIATEGIRDARAKNQNIGLDKMHTYLRHRPLGHPRAGEPWWQILDIPELTSLVDELKKARKPRQTALQKEIKNEGEQIRDKDNHAIDAQKYLFIIAHDLRPVEWRTQAGDDYGKTVAENFTIAKTEPVMHDEVFNATLGADRSGWSIYGEGSYASMEA